MPYQPSKTPPAFSFKSSSIPFIVFPAPSVGKKHYDSFSPVTTGSASPPFTVHSEEDDLDEPIRMTWNYQSISAIPAYRGMSFELRSHIFSGHS